MYFLILVHNILFNMHTLKEIRLSKGLNQSQISDIIKSNTPFISNVENGQALPDLEDMITLENHFKTRIDWSEELTAKEKHDTVQSLIELCERYPIKAVLEAGARFYRRNNRPHKIIQFYAQAASSEDEPVKPLFPPNICQTCD